jgi:xanthine dehydrogenase YagR molybdenum-binding subunit
VAIEHVSTNSAAIVHASIEPISGATARSYACVNVATTDRQRRLNIPLPGSMRGPGHAQGNFALESAIDELAYELALDPVELRLRNYAEVHAQSGLPWSSNALGERYAVRGGALRLDRPQPRDRLDARRPLEDRLRPRRPQLELVSGPLPSTRGHHPGRAGGRPQRRERPGQRHQNRDAPAFQRAARSTARPGPLRARRLRHARVGDVRRLGAHSVARQRGLCGLRRAAPAIPRHRRRDDRSPLRGCSLDEVAVGDGRIHRCDDRRVGERYTDILARHGLDELTADAEATPPSRDVELANSGPFPAKFVEDRVDEDLGLIRVARITTAVDAGRILNEKTARSQIIGGIGQALEKNIIDPGTGRVTNATFGDYIIPVNADAPAVREGANRDQDGLARLALTVGGARAQRGEAVLLALGCDQEDHRDS